MLKSKELRDQTVSELENLYRDLSREIYGLRCELSLARKLEKPHQMKEKKRDRARVLTIIQQKMDEQNAANVAPNMARGKR